MYTYETRIFFTILIAAAVLALILGFFVVTIIRHQKRKIASEKEKLAAELLLLENERGRIAADLHDELGSLISAVKLNLECLDARSVNDSLILEKTGKYIDTTMEKIREISNNLMPQVLQQKGLIIAVKEFTELVNHTGSLTITMDSTTGELSMEQGKEIHVYRIIQEIINNSIKHAGGSVIQVSLSLSKDNLCINYTDNGNGFDKNSISLGKQNGRGLRNIVRRVDLLKGTIYLDTAPGKGVHYSIEIPLK